MAFLKTGCGCFIAQGRPRQHLPLGSRFRVFPEGQVSSGQSLALGLRPAVRSAGPLIVGGKIGGVRISLLAAGGTRRIAAPLGFGVSVGLVLTLILQPGFQLLRSGFWANAMAIGLSILAMSAFIGCNAVSIPAGTVGRLRALQ